MMIGTPTLEDLAPVFERDKGRCAWCGREIGGLRGFDWSAHHRLPRAMGGTSLEWVNFPSNILLLHGSGTTGHHGEVEREREYAIEIGFVIKHGIARPCDVDILHAVHGWVRLDNFGGTRSVEAAV